MTGGKRRGFRNRLDNIGLARSAQEARRMLSNPSINIIALLFARFQSFSQLRKMFSYGAPPFVGDYAGSSSTIRGEISEFLARRDLRVESTIGGRALLLYLLDLHRVQQELFDGEYLSGCFHTEENSVRFPYSNIPHTDVRHPRPGTEPGESCWIDEEYWRMVTVLCGDHLLLYPNYGVDRKLLLRFRTGARPFVNPHTAAMSQERFSNLLRALPHYNTVRRFPRLQLEVGVPVLIRHEPEHLSPRGGIHSGPAFEERPPTRRVLLHMSIGSESAIKAMRLSASG